jgi:hypothetical protein
MNRLYTLVFLLALPLLAQAQQSYSLKPYAITLPQVTTTQQVSPATVPQSAGNVVYNTDQQKVALNTGGQWAYLVTNSDLNADFPNFAAYQYSFGSVYQYWTIPAGVTKFAIELWGAGTGGNKYSTSGPYGDCRGGQAGGYARRIYAVASGATTVTMTVGKGGSGTVTTGTFPTGSQLGGETKVLYPSSTASLYATGNNGSTGPGYGGFSGLPFDGYRAFIAPGGAATGVTPLGYAQKDAANYVITLRLSDGGTAYGVQPGIAGIGPTVSLLNNSTAIANLVFYGANVGGAMPSQDGSYPGGGGACGYVLGGDGADGLVIIRW